MIIKVVSEAISALNWSDKRWVKPKEGEIIPGFYTRYGVIFIYVIYVIYDIYVDDCDDIYVGQDVGPMPGNSQYQNMICVNHKNNIIRCDDMSPISLQNEFVSIWEYNMYPYVTTFMSYDIYVIDCRHRQYKFDIGNSFLDFQTVIGPWFARIGVLDHHQVYIHKNRIYHIIKKQIIHHKYHKTDHVSHHKHYKNDVFRNFINLSGSSSYIKL